VPDAATWGEYPFAFEPAQTDASGRTSGLKRVDPSFEISLGAMIIAASVSHIGHQ
jgi:hypothetical protein